MSSSSSYVLGVLLVISLSFSSVTVTVGGAERCNANDKKALLQMKKELKNIITWDPKTDCCVEWYGVTCDDKSNRIINVVIKQANLHVPIPAAVGELPYLQGLAIRNSNATGVIPQAISKLSQLDFLDLRQNLLTGPVPSFLGNLRKLNYIGLSHNSLTGSIPASLSQLPLLDGLLLEWNKLTGPIPASFGDFKAKQLYFYLSHNQLSGPIPPTLARPDFNLFDVSRNNLEGDLSFMFGKNKNLNTGYFSRNQFHFDFSKVVFASKKLQNLDLSHNNIFGSLPPGLTKIGVSSLNVSYNRLCGQIPVGADLQQINPTAFSHNKCLCGAPLPKCK